MAALDDRSRAALDFIRTAGTYTRLEELSAHYLVVAQLYGVHRTALVHIATPGQPAKPRMLISHGDDSWRQQYLEEGLQRFDPLIPAIFTASKPFTWSELRQKLDDPKAKRMFELAAQHGNREALVVPVHSALGDVSAMLMATDELQFADKDRPLLHLMAQVYASVGRSLVELEEDVPAASTINPLTPREAQCLAWAARGKGDWAIAKILGISDRTVESHIENARAKLQASTRTQAIFEAWKRGWMVEPIG